MDLCLKLSKVCDSLTSYEKVTLHTNSIDWVSNEINQNTIKLSCDSRFQRAFTAFSCAFKVITLVGSNQGTYFVNVSACSKRTLKTTVATELYLQGLHVTVDNNCRDFLANS